MICNLCPRFCSAERTELYGSGFCGMGTDAVIARAAPHMWEEPCISGTRGSGTIFFSGCSLGCVFCQNEPISRHNLGKAMNASELARLMQRVEELGVHNINLVTPSHFTPVIAEALSIRKIGIPVVWNSSGYELPETLSMLDGLVDIFLPDFKYSDPATGECMANAPDYFERATAAISAMCRMSGPPRYNENGMMLSGTIVRHLVLPLRIRETMQILDAVKQLFPAGTPISLMRQYTPMVHTDIPGLERRLTDREYERACSYMMQLEIPGYIQDKKSALKSYTPQFLDKESIRLFEEEDSDET